MHITFDFEGRTYTVGIEAYKLDRIVLPDGRVLEVEGWHESYPPKPKRLHNINHIFTDKPEEIANFMNATVAEEAKEA